MFDTFEEISSVVNTVDYPQVKEFSKETLLKNEKEYVGIYLSGHPLDDYLDKYDGFDFTSDMIAEEEEESDFEDENEIEVEREFDKVKDGQPVKCGGLITDVKKVATKSGNMAILTIEDINGNFDVMLFPKHYTRLKDIAVEDKMVTIRGRISIRSGKSPVVITDNLISWDKNVEES